MKTISNATFVVMRGLRMNLMAMKSAVLSATNLLRLADGYLLHLQR